MVGRATLIVIIGFAMIFGVAGQYWGETSNGAVDNFVEYYDLTAARNLAADAANLACDSLFVDPNATSMSMTYYDGDNSCQITSVPKVVSGRQDCLITAVSHYNDGGRSLTDSIQVWMQPIYMNNFAMFTQNENGVNWVTGDVVTGPFATNGKMYIDGDPIFRGKVTAVKGIQYNGKTNNPQFLGGFESGSGVKVNLPNDLSGTASAATTKSTFQPNSAYTGSNYAYDVYLTFNSDGTVTVTTKTQKYTPPAHSWGGATGTWSVVSSTSAVTDTLSSLQDAYGETVILVKNGDVHVQGTLSGSVSVVAEAGTGTSANRSSSAQTDGGNQYFNSAVSGNVIVDGNMEYNNPKTDMLGLVAQNSIGLAVQPSKADVTIDAAMLALNGSWTVLDYAGNVNHEDMGVLNVTGSICQNLRGAVGTESGGKIQTGYLKNYAFDNRFVNLAPPSYPQAIGQFQLVSWYE